MRVDRFRKARRLLSIACLIEAAACGLVIGELPEPASDTLDPGRGGVSGSLGTGGDTAGNSGNSGNDAGGGAAGQSGSGGQDGASGDGGISGQGGVGPGGTAGESGSGGASGTAPGGTAGTTGASATGGAAGTGGSAGSAGAGGSAGRGGTNGASGAGTGGSGATCDADGDMAAARSCGGQDCDDSNPIVKPGQIGWFETARPGGGGTFDYNCNSLEDREFPTPTICDTITDLTNCPNQPQGFLGVTPICGGKGNWGNCVRGGLGNLQCLNNVITVDKVMRCH